MKARLSRMRMRVACQLLDLAIKVAPYGLTGTARGDDDRIVGTCACVGQTLTGAAAAGMATGDELYRQAGVYR